ncbi:hypothetical protein F4775DRAFT_558153 [Biscogniauxia sp. FL1348]|nr:hypothetical protein F4775DRAFT_558153 [Biscogniauxia sp. FL1348]
MRPLSACRWGRLRSLSTTTRLSTLPPAARAFSDGSPPPPEARTDAHHDLVSYASYAARTGLDVKSTTFVGTRYEYTVAAALARYGFRIRRVGGPSDCGIDLLGTWAVPAALTPIRVILQCKVASRGTAIRPSIIRELEGTFVGAPAGWRGAGVLGLFVAPKPATKGVREAMGRSRWPMGFICCSDEGVLKQLIWNRKAEENGLEGMGVNIQFPLGDDKEDPRLILTWKAKPYMVETPSVEKNDCPAEEDHQLST